MHDALEDVTTLPSVDFMNKENSETEARVIADPQASFIGQQKVISNQQASCNNLEPQNISPYQNASANPQVSFSPQLGQWNLIPQSSLDAQGRSEQMDQRSMIPLLTISPQASKDDVMDEKAKQVSKEAFYVNECLYYYGDIINSSSPNDGCVISFGPSISSSQNQRSTGVQIDSSGDNPLRSMLLTFVGVIMQVLAFKYCRRQRKSITTEKEPSGSNDEPTAFTKTTEMI